MPLLVFWSPPDPVVSASALALFLGSALSAQLCGVLTQWCELYIYDNDIVDPSSQFMYMYMLIVIVMSVNRVIIHIHIAYI